MNILFTRHFICMLRLLIKSLSLRGHLFSSCFLEIRQRQGRILTLILFYLASGLDKVVGFQRSCTENEDDGHCTGDPLYGLVTCVYTCTGELCNSWVRGQLHTLFPANRNNRGTRTLQSRSSVHMIAIISVLLYISRLLEQ